jgi:hypothetical protein
MMMIGIPLAGTLVTTTVGWVGLLAGHEHSSPSDAPCCIAGQSGHIPEGHKWSTIKTVTGIEERQLRLNDRERSGALDQTRHLRFRRSKTEWLGDLQLSLGSFNMQVRK